MRDQVKCSDGPIAGRRFSVPDSPESTIEFEAVIDADQRVLAVCDEHMPAAGVEFQCVTFTYTAVLAADGERSRDDQGFLSFSHQSTADSW